MAGPRLKARPKLNTNPSKVQSTKPKSWLKRVAFSKYKFERFSLGRFQLQMFPVDLAVM
jgi:hypothetical protein